MAEEKLYAAKSRIQWLKAGDKNTKFFRRKVISHNARNRILTIQNEGVQVTNYKKM